MVFGGLSFTTVTVALTAFQMVAAALISLLPRTALVSYMLLLRGVNGSKIMSKGAEKECKNGKVRLVGGVTNSTGRLEFCANGVWGRVCNKLEYWGPDNARVVCRQLGFSEKGKILVPHRKVFISIDGNWR